MGVTKVLCKWEIRLWTSRSVSCSMLLVPWASSCMFSPASIILTRVRTPATRLAPIFSKKSKKSSSRGRKAFNMITSQAEDIILAPSCPKGDIHITIASQSHRLLEMGTHHPQAFLPALDVRVFDAAPFFLKGSLV